MSANFRINNRHLSGFTLMEVMIALLILALSFTALILVQARATKLALEAKTISVVTSLGRLKLNDCQMEIQKNIAAASDIHLDGDFKEQGFPDIKWECHAPRFSAKPPSAEQVADVANKKSDAKGADKKGAEIPKTDSSLVAPVITMVTDSLGDAVRELAVIVRYGENEEFRVVTHIVDVSAMAGLARMLSQGTSKKKEEQPKGKDEGNNPPPNQAPSMGPGPQGPGRGGPMTGSPVGMPGGPMIGSPMGMPGGRP